MARFLRREITLRDRLQSLGETAYLLPAEKFRWAPANPWVPAAMFRSGNVFPNERDHCNVFVAITCARVVSCRANGQRIGA